MPLIYLEREVAEKRVTAECQSCDLEGALAAVLAGTPLRATTIDGQFLIRYAVDDESSRATSYAGTVVDSATGEPVAQANIVLTAPPDSSAYRWCATGPSGFFSLRNVLPGEYTLHVRRVGYRTLRERLTVEPGPAIVRDIRLQGRELIQPRVTIEGRRSAFAAAEGISRGVFIRSAPSDHHQYYLEGARIYNPVHFGGLTSAFNGDALHDVQEIAGGVPPYYGGRIGGVLDVALRTGAPEAIAGSAEVGSLGSGLVLEGPISEATTYVVSGRQGYPDAFARAWQPEKASADLHSSELMFKLSQALPGNQRLSATGFFSRDANDRGVTGGPGLRLDNALRWRNAAASVRWAGVAGPTLFFSASAAFTDYGFSARHRWSSPGAPDERFNSEFTLQDLSLRGHAEYFYDEFHTMLAGVELVQHRLSGTISAFSSQILSMSLSAPPPWELSVY
ncbi:MAG: carboxypeptidase-like regulatory domain-containing protein, partial [Bacteroidota bacterium]